VGRSKEEADKQEALIKTRLLTGDMPSKAAAVQAIQQAEQSNTTFAHWAKVYVEIEEVKALRSYHSRCQQIEKVVVPFFNAKRLQDITVKDVEDFRRALSDNRKPATVNFYHNLLKHMLKHAMKRDLLMRNVACLVSSPKPDNRRDRVLSPKEWERVYGSAPEWFKPVLLTGYHTGMRLEEILGLTWDRVDLEKKRIFLPGSLTKNKKDREVPITLTLRGRLRELRQRDRVARIGGYVFTKDGQRISDSVKDREMRRLCTELKLEDFRFHDLRHCAVTNMAEAGVPPEVIMKAVGHSDVEMFLRYRSVQPAALDAAVVQFDTYLKTAQSNTNQTPRYAENS
jgi:integrase